MIGRTPSASLCRFEIPPDQKVSHKRSTLLLKSPAITAESSDQVRPVDRLFVYPCCSRDDLSRACSNVARTCRAVEVTVTNQSR